MHQLSQHLLQYKGKCDLLNLIFYIYKQIHPLSSIQFMLSITGGIRSIQLCFLILWCQFNAVQCLHQFLIWIWKIETFAIDCNVNKLGQFGFKFLIKRFKGCYNEVLVNFIKYLNKLMMMSAVTILTLFVTKFCIQ